MNEHESLRVPESLQTQLLSYRRRVWRIKSVEAVSIVVIALGLAFLVVYGWDRITEMPRGLRTALWFGCLAALAVIPWYVMRWMVRYRKLEALARLLAKRLPAVGDQLLGVIELAESDSEQARSMELCQAAMRQVAEDAKQRDFNTAAPPSRFRILSAFAVAVALGIIGLGVTYPAAAENAWSRLAKPWADTPRYTFTRIEPLADEVIVAHGEAARLPVQLRGDSLWQPATAELSIGQQPPIIARLSAGGYQFELPPQIAEHPLRLRVGDVSHEVTLKPLLRPELSTVVASVRLPEYLGRPDAQTVDFRGGRVGLVRGSQAVITATANRTLNDGRVNDQQRPPRGASLSSAAVAVEDSKTLTFHWRDTFGLAGSEPFQVAIEAIEDEAPTLMVDGLPRQAVVLDSELLKFDVRASDDFGVRRVGIMWRGLDDRKVQEVADGETPLAAGGHQSTELDVLGTFSAKSLGIEPQPIEVFAWVEDYAPGRQRVYSPPHVLYVLTPDQHAIWMTEQLSKWHRQALDVRDRERQLYQENKRLRELPPPELNTAESRRAVEQQASAERSNGMRLDRLGTLGDELVKAASRNPEIGVGHLERWAEMLQVLNDLSDNRMPSVADLLEDASAAPAKLAATQSKPGGPKAGQVRAAGGGGGSNEPNREESPKLRDAPQLVDMESSANSPDEADSGKPGPPKQPSSPALRLPVTTVMGKNQPQSEPPPADQQRPMRQAVEEQKDLLAEFDKLADEMNTVLANMEGSTLVKRLKAASRVQNVVAGKLTDRLQPAFGVNNALVNRDTRQAFEKLSDTEKQTTQQISYIMDDMSAYFQRRRLMQFKSTLEEMKQADVIGSLRQLSDDLAEEPGISIAQCEFWADSLDRWAENLVDPACNGSCPGGKSPESLSPSIVLEVLQILEAEINLREQTRVTEQAKPAGPPERYQDAAERLADTQRDIDQRVVRVIDRIRELPDAEKHFGKELRMLGQVDAVMSEAATLLARPDTGPTSIAAETEAIELLLASKRINPRGGGGGGATPGGGGGGNTVDSALALVGKGQNPKEVRGERGVRQTTGTSGTVFPEEFRRGLDQYFNRLEEAL